MLQINALSRGQMTHKTYNLLQKKVYFHFSVQFTWIAHILGNHKFGKITECFHLEAPSHTFAFIAIHEVVMISVLVYKVVSSSSLKFEKKRHHDLVACYLIIYCLFKFKRSSLDTFILTDHQNISSVYIFMMMCYIYLLINAVETKSMIYI